MYIELNIAADPKNYDSILNLLYLSEVKSILEEDGLIKAYFNAPEKRKVKLLKEQLINQLKIPPDYILISELPQLDWNKEWKATIEPINIKNRLIIYPSWKKKKVVTFKNKILIEIDPKMTFGTGHNESTQLLLEMMCDNITSKDKYLLDYGCGTGILAIAGIKLGVDKAVAIDIDKESIPNAEECLRKNGVSRKIKLYRSEINNIKESGFDAIVCNIDRTVITKNIKYIRSKLIVYGKLFISGILPDERGEILSSLEKHNFSIIDVRSKTEWLSFHAIKK